MKRATTLAAIVLLVGFVLSGLFQIGSAQVPAPQVPAATSDIGRFNLVAWFQKPRGPRLRLNRLLFRVFEPSYGYDVAKASDETQYQHHNTKRSNCPSSPGHCKEINQHRDSEE
jgi:hypothetical protein